MKLDRRRKQFLVVLTMSIVVLSRSLTAIYLHDNPTEFTSIEDINQNLVPVGSNVTVKGKIIHAINLWMDIQRITITDGGGNLTFSLIPSQPSLLSSLAIIVSGTVDSNTSIHPVSYVDRVLLFS
ncbi:MAG: hypothetical protein RTU92_15200 [Candidatus Thorarchaeota archaeon]